MLSSDILDFINGLERRIPVEDWRIEGLRLWPIVRIDLAFRCTGTSASPGSLPRPLGRMVSEARGCLRHVRAAWSDRHLRQAAPPGGCPVLLLSDGYSFACLHGRYYERFCDPIRDHLRDQGLANHFLTPAVPLVPRHSPSELIGMRLRWLWLRNILVSRLASSVASLPGFDDFQNAVRATTGVVYPQRRIERAGRLVRAYADLFRSHLDRIRPKVAFLVSYYNPEGFGFNLACREAGIPSVDLQHGVQGDLHPAYGRWEKTPHDGWEVLPSYFWCWSEVEHAAIHRWSATCATHRPLIGGNLLLDRARAQVGPFPPLPVAAVPGGDVRTVLVTLQPGFDGQGELALIRETIGLACAEGLRFTWWIRLHPCMGGQETRIRAALASDKGAIEVDMPSSVPLYSLLPYVDVHLTHSSSTVIEAEAFGIGSVLFSDYGRELFAKQFASGVAVLAESPPAIVAALVPAMGRKRAGVSSEAHVAVARAHRLIDDLAHGRIPEVPT